MNADQILTRLKTRLENASLEPGEREKLLNLVHELEKEIPSEEDTPSEMGESVRSALTLADASMLEGFRTRKNPTVLGQLLEATESSARDLEASYPRAAEAVRNFCHVISRMGI
jgi:hypothetical protein